MSKGFPGEEALNLGYYPGMHQNHSHENGETQVPICAKSLDVSPHLLKIKRRRDEVSTHEWPTKVRRSAMQTQVCNQLEEKQISLYSSNVK